MSNQHDATGAIRVTDEMVEAALTTWFPGEDWRKYGEIVDDYRRDMRAALTAVLALVPPVPGFRAGAEWAAGIIERGQQTSSTGGGSSLSPRVDGNRDGLAYAAAIRTALAALPEGGDGWRDISSAPKDGTHITVVCLGSTTPQTTVHWFDGAWQLSVNWDGEHSEYQWESLTHWRPLHAEPSPKGRAT